ncbi:MAG: alkylmercury lyase [Candidatus Dormiibacterota bacterium]
MTKEVRPPTTVKLLYVPGCPLIDQLRSTLRDCLTRAGASVVVEELEGPYPSPTLLIDGADVTGNALDQEPSCRIDLPTEEQIMAALMGASGCSRPTVEAIG